METYWISATFKGQDYWLQRQIDPAHPVSKHAFSAQGIFFNAHEADQIMQWFRIMGATDVHRWPADIPYTPFQEGEHWFVEFVLGVGAVIAVAVVHPAEP